MSFLKSYKKMIGGSTSFSVEKKISFLHQMMLVYVKAQEKERTDILIYR